MDNGKIEEDSTMIYTVYVHVVGVAKAQELIKVPDEPPNKTDVEESIKRLKDNDSKLTHLNLNNIKVSRLKGQGQIKGQDVKTLYDPTCFYSWGVSARIPIKTLVYQ